MPRLPRIVVPGLPHHVSQRGNHGQIIFRTDTDRRVYLDLFSQQAKLNGLRLLGYCLMNNHVHWIVVPEEPDSMAIVFKRVNSCYSRYFQTLMTRTGQLWKNRYYSCPMSERHLNVAMLYVERNPVRAGLVSKATDYPWSSARAHALGFDVDERRDTADWTARYSPREWQIFLDSNADRVRDWELERCTHSGRIFGVEDETPSENKTKSVSGV
jgi:putative transposase